VDLREGSVVADVDRQFAHEPERLHPIAELHQPRRVGCEVREGVPLFDQQIDAIADRQTLTGRPGFVERLFDGG
jgi:hypothetical protein